MLFRLLVVCILKNLQQEHNILQYGSIYLRLVWRKRPVCDSYIQI